MKYVIALIVFAYIATKVEADPKQKYKLLIEAFKAGDHQHSDGYLTGDAEIKAAVDFLHSKGHTTITVAIVKTFDATGDDKVNFYEFASAAGHHNHFSDAELEAFFQDIEAAHQKNDKISVDDMLKFLESHQIKFDIAGMKHDLEQFIEKAETNSNQADKDGEMILAEFKHIMVQYNQP